MMKTAKEIIMNAYELCFKGDITEDDVIEINETILPVLVKSFHSYAAEACKEQREICAEEVWHAGKALKELITNAPQPQLL